MMQKLLDFKNIVTFLTVVVVFMYVYKNCSIPMPEQKSLPLPKSVEFADEDTMVPDEQSSKEQEEEVSEPSEIQGIDSMNNMSSPLDLSNYEQAAINTDTGCGKNVPFLSSQLLPKQDEQMEENFAEFAPSNDDIQSMNWLQSDRTTASSQSTRNANLQLRSEPPNPKNVVCPWMQSTIETDDTRRPLEIGN